MTFPQSLKARLAANAGVVALIGTGAERAYPVIALKPDGLALLIFTYSETYEYVLDAVESVHAALEIRCYAVDYDAAHALAAAVYGALQLFKGLLGGAGGVNVVQSTLDSKSESFTQLTADQGMFEVLSRYQLIYLL